MNVEQIEQVDGDAETHQCLKADLFTSGQTERLLSYDLEIVIRKPNRRICNCREDDHPDIAVSEIAP